MNTSPSIAAIAAALAKAQKVIKPAVFDKTNPHFRNKYATLPAIMEVIRGPLADNGIAILQGAEAEGAQVKVTTRLAHSSGEWIESTLTMTAQQNTPQGVMAALTYCRRGSLSLLSVVSDEDDDGNAASEGPPKSNGNGHKPTTTPATGQQPAARRTLEERKRDAVNELHAMGYETPGVKLFVRAVLGKDKVESDAEMDRLDAALVIVRAEKNKQAAEGEDSIKF